MLTVCCLRWGDKYSPKYVEILERQVARNLKLEHRFVCLTERPREVKCEALLLPQGLPSWWGKVYLFRRGLLEGRVLFLDLDVCITNSLDELVEVPSPFCIISDWHTPTYNSSVMVWDADSASHIWDNFSNEVRERLHGDQDWITEQVPNAAVFPPSWCVSYRSHATLGVPKGAKVVVFHGQPKPHEKPSGWIENYWR